MLHDVENVPLLYSSPAASPGYTSSNTVPEVPFLCSSSGFRCLAVGVNGRDEIIPSQPSGNLMICCYSRPQPWAVKLQILISESCIINQRDYCSVSGLAG